MRKNKKYMMTVIMCAVLSLTSCGVQSNKDGGDTGAQEPKQTEADAKTGEGQKAAGQNEGKDRKDKLVLKLGIAHNDGQPTVLACQKFSEDVKEKTDGRIEIQVFPGGVLGNETNMRDAVSTGTLHMASLGAGVFGAYTGAANLPVCNYTWDSEEQMMEVLNGDLGKKYINDPVEQASGIHIINGWPQSARELLTVKPVNSLEELKGMKIRIPAGNAIYEDTWAAYGCLPVALAMDEVYTALEQNVIDGLEMPLDSLYQGGYHEKAKYLALTDHMMYLQYLMINSDTWKSLSAEEQKVIEECASEAESYQTELRDENLEKILGDMKQQGVTVTEVDKQEFMDATEPVFQKWMDDWGKEVYDEFRK